MRDFDFLEPTSVAEASRMLADLGEDCRAMAAGSALLLAMRQRMLQPTHIVSLGRIERLRGISFDPRVGLRIGALSRHCEVAGSAEVQVHYPMLASVAATLANPQVRNQATLGGNLCYADPATDPPSCLLALDARVLLGSTRGERELTMQEFLVDYYQTALAPDELLLEVRLPKPTPDTEGRYSRFLRTAAEHRPLVNVALVVRREGLRCEQARLVVGASTPIPARLGRAERLLQGQSVTHELVEQAAAMAAEDVTPLSDARGSEAYRRDMVRVVVQRNIGALFGLVKEVV